MRLSLRIHRGKHRHCSAIHSAMLVHMLLTIILSPVATFQKSKQRSLDLKYVLMQPAPLERLFHMTTTRSSLPQNEFHQIKLFYYAFIASSSRFFDTHFILGTDFPCMISCTYDSCVLYQKNDNHRRVTVLITYYSIIARTINYEMDEKNANTKLIIET